MNKSKGKVGRPVGTPGRGTYGEGVKTKLVRVPETIAPNIKEYLEKMERVQALVEDWEERIDTAAKASGTGQPSPRFERAVELLEELKAILA